MDRLDSNTCIMNKNNEVEEIVICDSILENPPHTHITGFREIQI